MTPAKLLPLSLNTTARSENAVPEAPSTRSTGPARRRTTSGLLIAALGLAVIVMALASAGIGQMQLSPSEVLASVLHRFGLPWGALPEHPYAESALWAVRFPRVVMAIVVGAALACSGVLMQGVFGNPLAEPGVVGVSSGAAAFACVVIVFGLNFFGTWTVAFAAFLGGLVATALVYATARSGGRTEVVTLVLTGVAINAVGGAVIALMTFLGDNSSREEIIFWQLGSLNGTRWDNVFVAGPVTIIGIALAFFLTHKLDLLALGERPARHLGVDVERLRIQVIIIVAILTGVAVAFAGIIGFVGLVVPHILRMAMGPGHKALLPASALGGALLLLAADTSARTLVPNADLPIGMLTALVGGPFFFWLIRRTRKHDGGWS
ncbi:heme ABC transporter permease [Arthrobacter psychrolactophilus]|uniref:Heme ABC transporter permease n=2 Tax=Arthrobacter psychrolactophilus TaxID=92442 RepID=A0A2V5IZR9_9MICC|nr:heme ABC transporter permease [Arthrobacter psychrolactophilus]